MSAFQINSLFCTHIPDPSLTLKVYLLSPSEFCLIAVLYLVTYWSYVIWTGNFPALLRFICIVLWLTMHTKETQLRTQSAVLYISIWCLSMLIFFALRKVLGCVFVCLLSVTLHCAKICLTTLAPCLNYIFHLSV